MYIKGRHIFKHFMSTGRLSGFLLFSNYQGNLILICCSLCRFYLGHWQEGIGKLFSFGGLGVWTLVDVVLVAVRYIGPADGSLYI
jgi:hypothetical protein